MEHLVELTDAEIVTVSGGWGSTELAFVIGQNNASVSSYNLALGFGNTAMTGNGHNSAGANTTAASYTSVSQTIGAIV